VSGLVAQSILISFKLLLLLLLSFCCSLSGHLDVFRQKLCKEGSCVWQQQR